MLIEIRGKSSTERSQTNILVEMILRYSLRSPDLICLDYYFWETMKELAYFQHSITLEEKNKKIFFAI